MRENERGSIKVRIFRRRSFIGLAASFFLMLGLLLPLLLGNGAARADGCVWTDARGPGNGRASALTFNPDRNELYRATNKGVWRYGSTTWYLAEGSTDGGMETWVLVQNPNPDAVTVNLTLMTDTGEQKPTDLQNRTIAGNSRMSFPIHTFVTTYNVSTKVEATGDVICERAMYGNNRAWAHDSIGFAP